jgi:ATP-dependent Clp protease ATP-binding subunit ClpA
MLSWEVRNPALALRKRVEHNHDGAVGFPLQAEGSGFMATPDESVDDIFLPGGRLRLDLLTDAATEALQEAVRLARETRWDSLRSPHVFMGLLAVPDACVNNWGERLQADLSKLLSQFQELFHQEEGEIEAIMALNREFLSDNVIRLLREAYNRAVDHGRSCITPMDLLISLLTASNSIVAECFERIGVTAAKLTELAVIAEHRSRGDNDRGIRAKQ